MAPIVLVFGLISGALSALMMLLTIPFMDRIGFEWGEVIGYTTILASFLLVYFGIRSYREKVAGGTLTFGRAFTVGILITLISSLCYVAMWQFVYYRLTPDFLDKYQTHMIEKAQARGDSEQELAETRQRMADFKELYKNPFVNIAFTFLEPFPIGLIVTLISAVVLRRRKPEIHPSLP